MKPAGHAAVSLSIGGAIGIATGTPLSVPAALCAGVLVDIDHLWDTYRWAARRQPPRVRIVLHSYELLTLVALTAYLSGWHPVVLAMAAAFLGHILADQLTHRLGPLSYLFTYRAWKGYDDQRGPHSGNGQGGGRGQQGLWARSEPSDVG